MYGQRMSHKLRGDRRSSSPGLNHSLVTTLVHRFDLPKQTGLDVWPLLDRSGHVDSLLSSSNDVFVRFLFLLAGDVTLRRLAPGGDGMTAPGRPPLATAVRVIDWIHRHTPHLRASS